MNPLHLLPYDINLQLFKDICFESLSNYFNYRLISKLYLDTSTKIILNEQKQFGEYILHDQCCIISNILKRSVQNVCVEAYSGFGFSILAYATSLSSRYSIITYFNEQQLKILIAQAKIIGIHHTNLKNGIYQSTVGKNVNLLCHYENLEETYVNLNVPNTEILTIIIDSVYEKSAKGNNCEDRRIIFITEDIFSSRDIMNQNKVDKYYRINYC